MIVWEGTSVIENYADYKGDIQYSQRGPLGIEVLKEEETETQITFRVNLYSNISTITELRWGFDWNIIIQETNYYTATLNTSFEPALVAHNSRHYFGTDSAYYNRLDKIELKEIDQSIWLLDTTLITVDRPKDKK